MPPIPPRSTRSDAWAPAHRSNEFEHTIKHPHKHTFLCTYNSHAADIFRSPKESCSRPIMHLQHHSSYFAMQQVGWRKSRNLVHYQVVSDWWVTARDWGSIDSKYRHRIVLDSILLSDDARDENLDCLTCIDPLGLLDGLDVEAYNHAKEGFPHTFFDSLPLPPCSSYGQPSSIHNIHPTTQSINDQSTNNLEQSLTNPAKICKQTPRGNPIKDYLWIHR